MTSSYVLRTCWCTSFYDYVRNLYTIFADSDMYKRTFLRIGEAIDIGLVENAVNLGLVGCVGHRLQGIVI